MIGFALHNATEGFGIVAPLAADTEHDAGRPAQLGLPADAGRDRRRPDVRRHRDRPRASPASRCRSIFLTLAAGSIIYVIVQLLAIAGRSTRKDLIYLGVLVGLLAGFATDAIVTAAGV